MRQRIKILSVLCLLCVAAHAQISDAERLFYENYVLHDLTSYEAKKTITRLERSESCNNLNYRGKAYAPLFIPCESDSILNIRINLIFIQKDDGTGNFQENNAEHQSLFNDVMIDLNRIVSSLVLPDSDCFLETDTDMLHDMRIRFVDHRYYVKNSEQWNNNLYYDSDNLCPAENNWYLSHIDDSLNNIIPNSLKGINIYFTEDSTVYQRCWVTQNMSDTADLPSCTSGACSQFPSENNLSRSSCLHMPCSYSKFWWMKYIVTQLGQYNYSSWEGRIRYWWINSIALSLAHELGHSLNLCHPNDPHEYGNSYFSYPDTNCSSTIMSQHSWPRNFLPPNEIGLIYLSAMRTNLQKFIPENTYLGIKNLNTTVSLPRMRSYYSLEIGPSGNVTIPCDITFSPQGRITIQNGGVLSIEGGSLHSIQNIWQGIVVLSGGKLILSNVNINDYDILVKSGGSVVIKDNLNISGEHSINIETGGYICIDEDATINLIDNLSYVMISPNAIMGCVACSENCIQNISDISYNGNGHIATYETNNYIQNTTITGVHVVVGDTVYAGYDVTPAIPFGDVTVMPSGHLRIKADKTILTKKFEVKLGGALLVTP